MSLYSEFIEEKIKIECPICYLHQSDFFTLPDCLHSFCTQCTKCHIETLINDAQVNSIFCPTCLLPIHKYTIAAVVSAETLAKYEKFVMRNNLINNPYAKFCPQPESFPAMYVSTSTAFSAQRSGMGPESASRPSTRTSRDGRWEIT